MTTAFFDANCPPQVVESLKPLAPDVTFLHTNIDFAPDMPDEEWLRMAGEERWIVITFDYRIRKVPEQRRIVEEYRVLAYFPPKKLLHMKGIQKCLALMDKWEAIRDHACANLDLGGLFQVQENGRIKPV